MEESDSAYDVDSTIFSPDGRLFQVEYARETVKKGGTTIGLKFNNGVLLLAYKDIYSTLLELNSIEKISKINNNIGYAYIGLSADARHLLDYAKTEIANNYIWYEDQIPIKTLVENICEYKHIFTTYYGLRPFGVILFIAGVDMKGVNLYATDPSGAFLEYKVVFEGKNSSKLVSFFNKHYKIDLDKKIALKLGIEALKKTMNKKISIPNIEIAIIEKNKPFYKLTENEIKKLL